MMEQRLGRILSIVQRWRQPHILPVCYFIFILIGGLFALFSILREQSESKNAFLLGYSLERILLSAALILIILILVAFTVRLVRQPKYSRSLWEWAINSRAANITIFWIAAALVLISWITVFMPSYRIDGNLEGYISQLKPIIIWLAVVAAITMLIVIAERSGHFRSSRLRNNVVVWAGFAVLILFILTAGIVATTGIGIIHPDDYWYASGVPILGLQVFLAASAGMFLIWLEYKQKLISFIKFDTVVCLVLWLITAWLWAREPIRPNFFMPDTLKNAMYPYSDSATFDGGSQFALIGQGIFNGQYFDRALYIAFLTYLHGYFGQDFDQMMTAQAVVYSIFPVIIYLLGKELHSRALGVSAAVLISLRGLNSLLSATWIDLASPKMILTDFAAAIGIALFALLVTLWIKKPSKKHFAVWAGGVLGLTIMLRTNVLVLLPMLIIFMWVGLRPRWNYLAIGTGLLILGMLISTTPWDLRNRQNGTPMFYVYYSRIQQVLRDRYGVQDDTYEPTMPLITSEVEDFENNLKMKFARQRIQKSLAGNSCDTRLCRITNHFFHNFITSILFLPTSFTLDDLWNTIKLSAPYWKNDWRGEGFGIPEGFFLLLNLTFISLGFGTMWERNRVVSLLPAIIFLVYLLSNALGFTSGGRYIVPVDWIICVYYIAGVLQVFIWIFYLTQIIPKLENNFIGDHGGDANRRPSLQMPRIITAFVVILLIGSLIPLAEMLFERRYQVVPIDETLVMLEKEGLIDQSSFGKAELSLFLTDPQAIVIVGRALYPRYYRGGEGEMDRHYPYLPLDYSRLVFGVIGPYSSKAVSVIIPGEKPKFTIHAEDVVVIGCSADQFLDALVVFTLSEPKMIYLRSSETALQCPLRKPD